MDSLSERGGYFGVQRECVCLCERGIRSQTGPSVVQLGWLNEISDSNINSSASLMRTMRGNRFSKERHYGSSCGDRAALFTKVIGHRGLETVHHTTASTLLCSATLISLTLGAAFLRLFFFFLYLFDFQEQRPKWEKFYFWNPEAYFLNVCMCVNGLKGEAIQVWLIK